MYTVKLVCTEEPEAIQTAIALDHAAFPFEDWITREDAYRIYTHKKDCMIWLLKDHVPIGLANLFALNEQVLQTVRTRRLPIYHCLTEAVLADAAPTFLYWHCCLLRPEYRGKGLIYKLYAGMNQWLEEFGGPYQRIYADAVSPTGRRCLERVGFVENADFGAYGALYMAEKNTVQKRIRRQSGKC